LYGNACYRHSDLVLPTEAIVVSNGGANTQGKAFEELIAHSLWIAIDHNGSTDRESSRTQNCSVFAKCFLLHLADSLWWFGPEIYARQRWKIEGKSGHFC